MSFRRRAFTLLELLVIVAILGTMVTLGVVSVASGQGAVRVKSATRDVFAAVRRARSTALVTQQPVVVEYSTAVEDEQSVIRIKVTSVQMMDSGVDLSRVRTLTGEPLASAPEPVPVQRAEGAPEASGAGNNAQGDTLEEYLFAEVASDTVKGMRIKVVKGEELEGEVPVRRSRASVFSNVDYLLGKYEANRKKTEAEAETKEKDDSFSSDSASSSGPEPTEPVSVVWAENGRVDPHRIWVYAEGKNPEDGLCINIDRFGAAKVISETGDED